ncbi:MAG: transketolase [Actinobacteria bacterium RBG_16_64_13]|nr:MAG: transketolase [Actinobacteria bacterium RBG_16_64_13]
MADRFPESLAEGRDIDELAIDTIRTLAIDAVQKANSGHPGMPLGAAPMAHVLWTRHLRFDPADPHWPDRDRFVLSAGHGSMLLYALLHLSGYGLTIHDLESFRQWGSKTPGHPEFGHTPGVETTTGPLGAGFSNAVGMAIAEAFLGATFNRPGHALVDHCTFVIAGDGDLMEGVSAEAASLAGHLGLGKLIVLHDDNHVTIEGGTDLAFTEDVGKRFEAYGWQVLTVEDGNDLAALDQALGAARSQAGKPSLVKVRTTIGYGSPHKAGTAECHGSPLGDDELRLTKEALGWPADLFFAVPKRVRAKYEEVAAGGAAARAGWEASLAKYKEAHPDLARQWEDAMAGRLPDGWKEKLPIFAAGEKMATRSASGKVLNALAGVVPTLIGGSADLAPSNNTYLAGLGDFERGNRGGRNLRFGVREHAMGGILNGMAYHGGLFPFGGTFFIFTDYMRPAMRLAALSRLPVVFVLTHDSVALGEDGPTHQPVEHLASLRAMPRMTVIRPSDANETSLAWLAALERRDGPTALVLTRQNLPVLDRSVLGAAKGLLKGGYVVKDVKCARPSLILIATGSEVHVALEAAGVLATHGVGARVVALPSWEIFQVQSAAYRESVLPAQVKARVVIEAGSTFGWERYAGPEGAIIGIDHFGASAPGDVLYERFRITADNVVKKALALVG